MAPYLLLGFLLAGVLKQVIRTEVFAKHLGKDDLRSVTLASLFGAPLPLCSCSVVPMAVSRSKVIHSSGQDRVAVIAAGITVHEALKAYETLKAAGLAIRVIDAYSVKPIDKATLHQAAKDCGGKLIVVEDHWPEGGLGDAVLEAFSGGPATLNLVKLAPTKMPGSATPAELLAAAGIDADHIAAAVKKLAG
jgi:transketolase